MAASLQTLRENKPLRNLALLAAITIIVVIAAIVAVATDRSSVRTSFVPHPLFEGLDSKLDRVDRIVYTASRGLSGEVKIVMLRGEDGAWGAESRSGYPVNPELVKKTLLGVGEMEAYEPRTANPEWHRNLGLLAPEDIGSAVRVEFFSGNDERLAGVLVGKVPERAVDVKGEGVIYVRRDGEDQTWLARGRLPLLKTVSEWLDPTFVDIPREDVARVTLWADTDRPVIMSRGSPEEANFAIENVPEGRVTRGAPVVNRVATALLDSGFDDVAPADTLDFPETAPQVVVETFDGVKLTMRMGGQGGALWARFSAAADAALLPDGADASKAEARAAALNARLGPWVYKLPQDVSSQLTQTMDIVTREAGPADFE
ncbi:hypothetical protein Plav_1400 [Parvibaculum lavamentivorans DS-1]|uniref:DUF4340 domain-containing protein n=1 Tax=Parvibaculum lavamentivorans (strain DS-1 / DSM 13023 / NCIMB 13966) TaxID=402881 RepID=A7HSY7_PARL1|nr:DUF4340 domain-containing protein [Parvibaculum lavamentivorans]ABS63020.1 hypothetical protein Plav_1400 [Parvibaculum lavamentivorans DS-1]